MRSIHTDLASSILYDNTAKEGWDDLAGRFHQPNAPRLFQIKQQISSLRQDNLSFSAYFPRLKASWDEQSSLTSLPACSCGTVKSASDLIQQDRVMQFLQGLHESFSALRSHILLIEPFRSVNKVYALVSQEEKQRELYLSHLPSTEADVLAAKKVNGFDTRRRFGNGGTNGIPRSTKNCRYFHLDGHTIEECYKLHGYPPRNPGKPSPNHHHHVNPGKPPTQHQHHANHTASANAQFPATPLQDVDSLLLTQPNQVSQIT